jgi:hypothetical protein
MFLDWTSFQKECDLNYFQNFLSIQVDEMCEKFTKCFLKIAQECIPTKIITIRNNDRPWFNNEIRKEIRIRDRFRKTIEFLRGGIQLFPLFDLISIFIIFQYVFGLDEFSKRM